MDLVERDELIERLWDQVKGTRANGGRLVFLAGAAGVGKTSVVRALADRARNSVEVLWGACDDLATPRALGPLHDMALSSPIVARLLAAGHGRQDLFQGFLEELARRSTVVIVEDVHWADEATLDFLRFLGRRIDRSRAVVAVTYRDHEVGPRHPLRKVLGDLATGPGQLRLDVSPLSPDGVARLASGHPIDPGHLHRITGGNPFYVTEVLAAPGWTVPPTVADAVLARAARLPAEVQDLLDTISVEPGPIEIELLESLGHDPDHLREAIRSGMLIERSASVAFRHELARQALLATIDTGRRRRIHSEILRCLEARAQVDPARLSHHANGAGDDVAVLAWGKRAGYEATATGAHREAAEQFRRAVEAASRLRPGGGIGDEAYADLLDIFAAELSAVDRRIEALEVREEHVAVLGEGHDPAGLVRARTRLAYALWIAGRGDESRALMSRARAEAEAVSDDAAAAFAYANAGYLAMLARSGEEALDLTTRAIELAEPLGLDDVLVRALNARGSARIVSFEDLGGISDLERSAALAEGRWDVSRADALENLGSGLGEIRRYGEARSFLERTIAFSRERDLDSHVNYSQAWLARVEFEQGRWERAAEFAGKTPDQGHISPVTPIVALTVLGRIRARRGDPGGRAPLQRAWELALETGDLQRLWPVAAGRAELAWLTSSVDASLVQDVLRTLEMAQALDVKWATGELALWVRKLDVGASMPGDAAEPFRLHLAGDYRAAARAWSELGCPYEQAWALADSDEEDSLRAALDIFVELGADPMATRVRQRLRGMGARGVPAGPRETTAAHPAGLTARQAEVLGLLSEGLTDRAIAERLYISPKTVGHHVSAILRKLEVRNRSEAIVWVGSHST